MKTDEEIREIFERVKHLIGSDEPIENPFEVHPHEFSESERATLLREFPINVTDSQAEEFLQHLARTIGAFHRISKSADKPITNSQARKKFQALRRSISRSHELFVGLPNQLHREIDLAIQHVMQTKHIQQGGEPSPYVRSFSAVYSDVTANGCKRLSSNWKI